MAATAAYIPVDAIPEIGLERQRVRQEARSLIEQRAQQQTVAGSELEIPPVIDALSTADRVIEARDTHGYDSPEYLERLKALDLDCLRLVAEWYRKKRPEYFKPLRHIFDTETGDFYSNGLSVRQMTERALRPIPDDPEEGARRINERVEDATPGIIRLVGGLALKKTIRTISECTDKAIDDYQEDLRTRSPHRGYGGYVPEIEKLMVRDIKIDADTGDRWQEQIGLPGKLINHEVIQEALRRRQLNADAMDKTELHGNQFLVDDDLMEFAKLLDTVAEEHHGVRVFMGEEVSESFDKDYVGFRAEAIARQEGLTDLAKTVATFVLDLADEGFDRGKAPAHVENFVKKLLLDVAKNDLNVAEQMFDKKTEAGLQQVVQLQNANKFEDAFVLMQKIEAEAPGGGYCSGGSCGLESVNLSSAEGRELKESLKAESGDTVVRDKERSCKACGAKKVVYAYNKNKVNKYCEGCHVFESKMTTGGKR